MGDAERVEGWAVKAREAAREIGGVVTGRPSASDNVTINRVPAGYFID